MMRWQNWCKPTGKPRVNEHREWRTRAQRTFLKDLEEADVQAGRRVHGHLEVEDDGRPRPRLLLDRGHHVDLGLEHQRRVAREAIDCPLEAVLGGQVGQHARAGRVLVLGLRERGGKGARRTRVARGKTVRIQEAK